MGNSSSSSSRGDSPGLREYCRQQGYDHASAASSVSVSDHWGDAISSAVCTSDKKLAKSYADGFREGMTAESKIVVRAISGKSAGDGYSRSGYPSSSREGTRTQNIPSKAKVKTSTTSPTELVPPVVISPTTDCSDYTKFLRLALYYRNYVPYMKNQKPGCAVWNMFTHLVNINEKGVEYYGPSRWSNFSDPHYVDFLTKFLPYIKQLKTKDHYFVLGILWETGKNTRREHYTTNNTSYEIRRWLGILKMSTQNDLYIAKIANVIVPVDIYNSLEGC